MYYKFRDSEGRVLQITEEMVYAVYCLTRHILPDNKNLISAKTKAIKLVLDFTNCELLAAKQAVDYIDKYGEIRISGAFAFSRPAEAEFIGTD